MYKSFFRGYSELLIYGVPTEETLVHYQEDEFKNVLLKSLIKLDSVLLIMRCKITTKR